MAMAEAAIDLAVKKRTFGAVSDPGTHARMRSSRRRVSVRFEEFSNASAQVSESPSK